jgi:Flp pilus assembly protein TadG
MRRLRTLLGRLSRDRRGLSAVEFALIAPVFLLIIFGMLQLGILFMANHGLRNAVAEGARHATIFPRPTDAQIVNHIEQGKFGLHAQYLTKPKIEWNQVSGSGAHYVDISLEYLAPVDFIFFETPPIKLRQTRRAFVQPPTAT